MDRWRRFFGPGRMVGTSPANATWCATCGHIWEKAQRLDSCPDCNATVNVTEISLDVPARLHEHWHANPV